MSFFQHRTKIVATIGPASDSPETIKQMMHAGMSVARLNFSHGKYADHAQHIQQLRELSAELELPLTLLQDLQGPKIRVGDLPPSGIELLPDASLTLVPLAEFNGQPHTVAIDYSFVAEEAEAGTPILLDDGLLELKVEALEGKAVICRVVTGGRLKSHKGVNFPTLNLRLPSLTEKDKQDLAFGVEQGVDIVSLSFVRRAEDVQELKALLQAHGSNTPVLAKLEKPQAIANLESIVNECDAIMVARGDLGVEMSPEKVPLIQKRIIRLCNQRGIPVITATQMLDSMIRNPRPTRAEVSDVANAIMDGTDAVMLSGESAVGDYPVESVQMLARIATDVEPETDYINYPPPELDDPHAITEALRAIDEVIELSCIVTFTETGHSAKLAAAERPSVPVVAITENDRVYHQLNLAWGVKPLLVKHLAETMDGMFEQIERCITQHQFAQSGDKVLVIGGIPMGQAGSTNFLKIHTIGETLLIE